MTRLESLIRAAMQALENSRLVEAYKILEQALEEVLENEGASVGNSGANDK